MADLEKNGAGTPADSPARLHGIGVGPGDPELITVKGLRLLRAAEVVFVPVRAPGAASLAGAIVADYLDPARQEIVPLVYPAQRAEPPPLAIWNANADAIAARLAMGRTGVFLTEGDPLLCSTFVHALLPLRERHPTLTVAVVPGIWSGAASAAALAQPLLDGDERLAVLPALYGLDELGDILAAFDTVVLLKPSLPGADLAAAIRAHGASAVWVRRVGQAGQKIVRDLDALPAGRLDYFSLLIVRSGAQHTKAVARPTEEMKHS